MFSGIGSTWAIAGGAALITLVASFWSHVKNFYHQVVSRVIMTITVSGYQADAMLCYLRQEFEASRWGPRAYMAWMLYVKPKQRVQLVPMEVTPSTGRIFWKGWKPLWTADGKSDGEQEVGVTSQDYDAKTLTVSFFRGLFQADELIIDAVNWYNEHVLEANAGQTRRHFVRRIYGTAGKSMGDLGLGRNTPSSNTDLRGCLQHRMLAYEMADLGVELSKPGKATSQLALTADAEELVSEARYWKSSEEWYKSHSVPWRRGWLLYGEPGTGKTALARATAEDLDLPVFVFDLASLHNNELQEEWARMLSYVPCMALIEDIDAVFDRRRNISGRERQHLTFDCFLNCLDGIERADGLFVVLTTNRLEKIDPALGLPDPRTGSSRPGRIDRVLEMPPLDDNGRDKIAQRILAEWPDVWSDIVVEGQGDTGAQFQERCARRAIELHFDQEVAV